MRILFDPGTPVPLRRYLHPHSVDTAAELGWSRLENGDLRNASKNIDVFEFTLLHFLRANGASIPQPSPADWVKLP
jgi:hypothetical protein